MFCFRFFIFSLLLSTILPAFSLLAQVLFSASLRHTCASVVYTLCTWNSTLIPNSHRLYQCIVFIRAFHFSSLWVVRMSRLTFNFCFVCYKTIWMFSILECFKDASRFHFPQFVLFLVIEFIVMIFQHLDYCQIPMVRLILFIF